MREILSSLFKILLICTFVSFVISLWDENLNILYERDTIWSKFTSSEETTPHYQLIILLRNQ